MIRFCIWCNNPELHITFQGVCHTVLLSDSSFCSLLPVRARHNKLTAVVCEQIRPQDISKVSGTLALRARHNRAVGGVPFEIRHPFEFARRGDPSVPAVQHHQVRVR